MPRHLSLWVYQDCSLSAHYDFALIRFHIKDYINIIKKAVKKILGILSQKWQQSLALYSTRTTPLPAISEAENWLKVAILNFHYGLYYLPFITEKASGKLLGMIDIVTLSELSIITNKMISLFYGVLSGKAGKRT